MKYRVVQNKQGRIGIFRIQKQYSIFPWNPFPNPASFVKVEDIRDLGIDSSASWNVATGGIVEFTSSIDALNVAELLEKKNAHETGPWEPI